MGHVAQVGEVRDVYNIWVGKPGGKRAFERPGHEWNNITWILGNYGWRV